MHGDRLGRVGSSEGSAQFLQFVIERNANNPSETYPFLPFTGWFQIRPALFIPPPGCTCKIALEADLRTFQLWTDITGFNLKRSSIVCPCFGRFLE